MKLWAELTMSLQKVETKSNMENDGAFSCRLCRGAGTSHQRCPLLLSPTPAGNVPPRAHGWAEPGATSQGWKGMCQGHDPIPGGSPREGCAPWGDHPALGPSPSPGGVPLGRDHPPVPQTMGAERPRCRGRSSPGSLSVPWILGRRGSLLFLKHPCWNPLGCSLPLAPNIFRQPLARSNQQTGNK